VNTLRKGDDDDDDDDGDDDDDDDKFSVENIGPTDLETFRLTLCVLFLLGFLCALEDMEVMPLHDDCTKCEAVLLLLQFTQLLNRQSESLEGSHDYD
jgi:hypothetical protein